MKKKYTKEFYMFLCKEGLLFQFLDIVKNTQYKTFKKHCEVNKPVNYVNFIYTFGTGRGKGLIFLDDPWNRINKKWIKHLSINLYKMKK